MSFESKLPLFFLFLSVLLASTLAIEFPNHHQDARHELMKCMERCQTRQDGREQRECIQECHQGYKERQQEEERERWGGYGEELLGAMINPSDHDCKEDLEKCQLDCLSEAKRGIVKELECVKKCAEEHKEERGRHSVDKVDELLEDKSELEKCQRYCVSGAKHTYIEIYECEKKCFEDYSERERRRERYSVDKDDHSDEKHKLEKCQLDCMTVAKHGVIEVYECEKKCVEEYQKRHRGKQSVDKNDDNDNDHSDDKHELKKCLIDCALGAKHTVEEVWECDMKCMKDHPDKRDVVVVNQQDHKKKPKCQRQCWRKSPGGSSSVEYECTTVCRQDDGIKHGVNVVQESKNTDREQPQRRLSECLKKCQRQGEGHECQQRCQKEFQRRHPILGSIMELTAGLF
ncbi:antimicrobial peptide X precursor-like [Chenopodium quinoa]|uniref:antimicrobial peptide X precursor-like n=1 Tax=Chenopodium quinoa TaxID=63459 RepID=UPI000B783A97|nr:antimicrobial peptide X precursor-like [Chenopodium quinoa]